MVGATVIRMADVSLTGRKIQTLELKDYRGEVAVKLDVLVGIRRRGSGAPADPGHRRRGHAGRIDVRWRLADLWDCLGLVEFLADRPHAALRAFDEAHAVLDLLHPERVK